MARVQKITIVGVGHVGEASALALAQADLCWELALMARDPDKANGVASDIQQSAPVFGFDTSIVYLNNLGEIAGSDIVILSAGHPRVPGMETRSDLLETNLAIVQPVAEAVRDYCPGAVLIVVTNPVDVMTYYAWQISGLPRNRVIGLAGVLDSSRMAYFLAEEVGVSVQDVNTLVIGGHGDQMLPLTQVASIGGVPITALLDQDVLEKIVERTRTAGTDILNLRKTGTSFHAPAASILKMVDAIVGNRFRLLPVTSVLDGEYGLRNIAMGVPCILSASGISKIVELELDEKDTAQLYESAEAVEMDIEKLPL